MTKELEEDYGIDRQREINQEMSDTTSDRFGSSKNNNNDVTKQSSWSEFADSVLNEYERINGERFVVESKTNKGRNKRELIKNENSNKGSFNLQKKQK